METMAAVQQYRPANKQYRRDGTPLKSSLRKSRTERKSNQGSSELTLVPDDEDAFLDRHHRHHKQTSAKHGNNGARRTRSASPLDKKYSKAEKGRSQHSVHEKTPPLKPPSKNVFRYFHQISPPTKRNIRHGFLLSSEKRLSPRADAWLILSISTACTLGSLAISTEYAIRTSWEEIAMLTSILVFTASTIVLFCYRFAPFRKAITRTIAFPTRIKNPFSKIFCIEWSRETILSILSLILTTITTCIVMRSTLSLATSEYSVWNPNLFCSCWIGLYACLYLAGDLVTTDDPSGTIANSSQLVSIGTSFANATARLWFMTMGSSIFLLGSLLDLYSSTVCESALQASSLCSRALTAVLVSLTSIVLSVIAQEVHRISFVEDKRNIYLKWYRGDRDCAFKSYRCVGSILSFLVFALSSMNIGVVSSPSGPGFEMGSIFITTWMSFALSLITFKRYIDMFCMPMRAPAQGEPFNRFNSSTRSEFTADMSFLASDDDEEFTGFITEASKNNMSTRSRSRTHRPSPLRLQGNHVSVEPGTELIVVHQRAKPTNGEADRRRSSRSRTASSSNSRSPSASRRKCRTPPPKIKSSTRDTEKTSVRTMPPPPPPPVAYTSILNHSLGVPQLTAQEPLGTRVGVSYVGKHNNQRSTEPRSQNQPRKQERPPTRKKARSLSAGRRSEGLSSNMNSRSRSLSRVSEEPSSCGSSSSKSTSVGPSSLGPSSRNSSRSSIKRVPQEPPLNSPYRTDPPFASASISESLKQQPEPPSSPASNLPCYLPIKHSHKHDPEVEVPLVMEVPLKAYREAPEVEVPREKVVGSANFQEPRSSRSSQPKSAFHSQPPPRVPLRDERRSSISRPAHDSSRQEENSRSRSTSTKQSTRGRRQENDAYMRRSTSPKSNPDVKQSRSGASAGLDPPSALKSSFTVAPTSSFDVVTMSDTSSVTPLTTEGFSFSDKWPMKDSKEDSTIQTQEPKSKPTHEKHFSDITQSFNVLFNDSSQSEMTRDVFSQSELTRDAFDFNIQSDKSVGMLGTLPRAAKPDGLPRRIRVDDDVESFLTSADSSEFTTSSRVASVGEVVDLALAYARSTLRTINSVSDLNISSANSVQSSIQSMFSEAATEKEIFNHSQSKLSPRRSSARDSDSTKDTDSLLPSKSFLAHRRSSLGSDANPVSVIGRMTVPTKKSKSLYAPNKKNTASSAESLDSEDPGPLQFAGILRKMTPSFHARNKAEEGSKTVSFHDKNTFSFYQC